MPQPVPIFLIGAGEQGRVIEALFSQQPEQFEVRGFLDDQRPGPRVLGPVADFIRYPEAFFFVCIGNNAARLRVYRELKAAGAKFANAIHPRAVVETPAVGENVFVGALSYVSASAHIGNAVYINNHCVVEHDNIIADGCHIAPGAVLGGGVELGAGVFVGLGARINDHLSVGAGSVIGSGAVVTEPVPPGVMAAGVPATVRKTLAAAH